MKRKFICLFTIIYFFNLVFLAPISRAEDQGGIQWYEWGPNAFELSKKEDKPILLYLTSSWCHWCRVMDAETFADPEIISQLNRFFVPVKVDTDLRPDLNARYTMGGWPSTVFLTSEGSILVGASFLSAGQLKAVLPEIEKLHSEKQKEFDEKSRRELAQYELILGKEIQDSKDEEFAPSFIDKISASLLLTADDELGGMGREEKYPIPEVTEFLFLLQEVRPDLKATKILNSFFAGERKLFDPEMGGFYRYASKPDWTEPQFEKMLGVNALLTRDLIWNQAFSNQAKDKEMIQATLNYLEETLLDKALGGFFGSQGSDLILVTSGLDQKEDAALVPGGVYYSYPKAKRLELGLPPIDRHVYSNSCAQMISTLLELALRRNDVNSGKMALRALDFLMDVSFDSSSGMKHVFPEPEKSSFLLENQVWTLKALEDAFEYTQDKKYQTWFNQLLAQTEKNFGTGQGIFYDMSTPKEAMGNLKRREVPLVENCLMARIYITLMRSTGKEIYRQKARAILNFFAPRYQQFSVYAAAYGSALIDWFYPTVDIKIFGKKSDPQVQSLWQAVQKLPSNRIHVQWMDLKPNESPKILICVGSQCLTPVESPEKLPVVFEVAQKIIQSGT